MTKLSTPQTDISDSERKAAAGVLDLLARFWARELDRKDLLQFVQSEMASCWVKAGGWLPPSVEGVTETLVDDLAVDYCQLIVGPRHQIPPVQSVWISGSYGNDEAQSMQRFIDVLPGFAPCCSVVDHIAVQLQYTGALFSIDRATLGIAERESFDIMTNRFFQTHMLWSAKFLDLVEQGAETLFYQGLARVTRNTLSMISPQIENESIIPQSP